MRWLGIHSVHGYFLAFNLGHIQNSPDSKKFFGFHDFAGSTVVHSVGGWFALAAAQALGARNQRLPPFNRGYAVLGVFLLWFGWWGFNGGSTLLYDDKNTVPNIILHTNIAGAAAGFAACVCAWLLEMNQVGTFLTGKAPRFFRQGNIPEKTIGGVLGGLVAITASCDVATPGYAFVVGIIAGVVHNMAFDWLLYKGIDDPVGAIPVHAYCGVTGTLLVMFAPQRVPNDGTWLIQMVGVAVAWAVSYWAARLCVWGLGEFGLLKLTPREEAVWAG